MRRLGSVSQWCGSALDRDATSPEAKTSPDRALIEEIDPKPRAVFFTDEMSAIKKQMIDDEVNPYRLFRGRQCFAHRGQGRGLPCDRIPRERRVGAPCPSLVPAHAAHQTTLLNHDLAFNDRF